MPSFIGKKQVLAEPMNENDAVEKGYARPNEDNHEWREGYHVVYPDGYHSWSPKNVFEQSYSRCDTFLDRLYIELSEVFDRKQKLGDFIDSKKFKSLPQDDQTLLGAQYGAMVSYCQILIIRIERAERKKLQDEQDAEARRIEEGPKQNAEDCCGLPSDAEYCCEAAEE